MTGQLVFMLDDVRCGGVDRILISLIDFDTERLSRKRVHISARAERVFANVGPGEVWLDARRSFGDERDRSGRAIVVTS